jgi:hypothetical protein
MSNRITERDSLRIRLLAATGKYTPQEIASTFEDKYNADQILRHLGVKDPENKKKLKRETSRGAVKLKSILTKIFPTVSIKSEVHVGEKLMLDLYIPAPYNLGFEYDGVQHKKLTKHFHQTDQDLEDAKIRDQRKEELCAGRGISLVRISHDEEMTTELVQAKIDDVGYGSGDIQEGFETGKEKYKRKRREQNEIAKERKKKRYQQFKQSEAYKTNKQKQKEYRKEQYKRQKEWQKQHKKK